MKKQVKLVLLVALFACTTLPAWGQASTEGREFWVALNMTTGTAGGTHEPFICITTQHPGGSYTISNPADPSFNTITGMIPPTGYIKIKASTSPTAGQIDLNKWYPVGQTAPSMSCQTKNVGLKVTTTVDCSVFAGNMLPQSFDAANILPVTALQTDYITQDYPGYDHGGTSLSDGGFPEITILATENNTQVTVIPSTNVLNSNGTNPISKTLNIGQVLYITGENRASLSGSVVTSNKKIAVFTGVNNTDVPGPKSARDHLYEQNMPTVYWGTHFVVTRSMRKDANRIRVTASNNGTEVIVDGNSLATINAGETYEFELCEAAMRQQTPYTSAVDEGRGTEFYLDGEAHYLETTCPCAVFSYDVSENYYISDGTSERDPNAHGDPSMVWISPIEQQIDSITFGVMNTDKTTTHYVNIITPTNGASSLEVREIAMNAGQVVYGNNLVQPTDVKIVPSNPAYSYARIKLTENAESVYTIISDVGFIAHVYGSGDKESYAYSCGSAAVQQGVKVNGNPEPFTNGYRSDKKYCFGEMMTFDANVGTDEITRVDWTFGDGTTDYYGPSVVSHTYTAPGWYDVTAALWGHQACSNEDNIELGTVNFSFRIVRPDTVFGEVQDSCISLERYRDPDSTAYWDYKVAHPEIDTVQENCYDTVKLNYIIYNKETEEILDTIVGRDAAQGYNKEWYYESTEVVDTFFNAAGCYHFRKYYVKVLTCLDIHVVNNPASQHVCPGDAFEVTYTKTKGDIDGDAILKIPGYQDMNIYISNENVQNAKLTLPIQEIKRPGNYHAQLIVNDQYCETKTLDIDFTVYYPSDVFTLLYNNVLAVYAKGNGGNIYSNFTGFQWYLNGFPIPGATSSVYHTDAPFKTGERYSVVLSDGQTAPIPSCELTITSVENYNANQAPAAEKKLINRHIYIVIDDRMYDAYGQRVK